MNIFFQLFDRRGKYIKKPSEKKKWEDITPDYMSEESSGECTDSKN